MKIMLGLHVVTYSRHRHIFANVKIDNLILMRVPFLRRWGPTWFVHCGPDRLTQARLIQALL